jgi:hypothetical protein
VISDESSRRWTGAPMNDGMAVSLVTYWSLLATIFAT